MGATDANAVVGENARYTHKPMSIYKHLTLQSQTDTEIWQHTPGYNFEIIGFEVYCVADANVTTFNLLITATSVLTAVLDPVAGAAAAGVMKTDGSQYGTAIEIVYIQYTSGVAGVVGEATFQVWIRRRAADVT